MQVHLRRRKGRDRRNRRNKTSTFDIECQRDTLVGSGRQQDPDRVCAWLSGAIPLLHDVRNARAIVAQRAEHRGLAAAAEESGVGRERDRAGQWLSVDALRSPAPSVIRHDEADVGAVRRARIPGDNRHHGRFQGWCPIHLKPHESSQDTGGREEFLNLPQRWRCDWRLSPHGHRTDTGSGNEGDGQPAARWETSYVDPRSRGSRISRNASPSRFHPSTNRKITIPGKTTVYQYTKGFPGTPRIQLRDMLINCPQSAYPTSAPKPRNDRAAATRTITPVSNAA